MATEVKLPRLGQGMESGTIVRWLKAEGDSVKKREPLYELDTDKVTQEVESDLDGILLKIVVQEGEVEVGSTIAMIENGPLPRQRSQRVRPRPQEAGRSRSFRNSSRRGNATDADAASIAPAAKAGGCRIKASPLARRIARERGVDLAALAGTGPDGRIVADDVENAPVGGAAPAAAPGAATRGRRRDRDDDRDAQDDRAPAHRGVDGARLPARSLDRHDRGAAPTRADDRAARRG